jgi:2'-5' RNA ligase
MRLFTGIDLPDSIKEHLDVLISRLRSHAHIKWSPTYNLHITTKFIGEWPKERLPELDAALRTVHPTGPVHIEVRGVGWFPNPHHPRVFFAAIHAAPELAELVQATDAALAKLGVEPEARPYSPHLTLARIKEPVPLDTLRHAIAHLESVDFGNYTPDRFHLFLSRPGSAGSVYTKLQEYSLPRS